MPMVQVADRGNAPNFREFAENLPDSAARFSDAIRNYCEAEEVKR
jgi:hypothetical protein